MGTKNTVKNLQEQNTESSETARMTDKYAKLWDFARRSRIREGQKKADSLGLPDYATEIFSAVKAGQPAPAKALLSLLQRGYQGPLPKSQPFLSTPIKKSSRPH